MNREMSWILSYLTYASQLLTKTQLTSRSSRPARGLHLQLANFDEAQKAFLKTLEFKTDIDSLYNIAVIYMYQERHKDAMEYFMEVRPY